MTQVSAGFQAGAKAYSQIVFFQDKRALDEFESGSFEFSAGVSAVAVTGGGIGECRHYRAPTRAPAAVRKMQATLANGYQKGHGGIHDR